MYLQSITSEKPSTLCKTVILSTSFSFGRLWAESSNCISCPDWNKTKSIVIKDQRLYLRDRKKVVCDLASFCPKSTRHHWRLRGHLTFNNEPVSRQKSLGAQLTLLYCYRECWPTAAVIILDLQRTDIFVALTRGIGDCYEHNPRLPS